MLRSWWKRRSEPKPKTAREKEFYEMGQEVGRTMANAADRFLEPRLEQLTTNYMTLFADRMQTIHSEPGYSPVDVAKAELKIFIEHLKDARPQLLQEAYDAVGEKWMNVVSESGLRDDFDNYALTLIDRAEEEWMRRAMEMVADAVSEPGTPPASGTGTDTRQTT
jgi:hypothetical protein